MQWWWVRKKLHGSWLLAAASVAFVAGVFIALFWRIPAVYGIGSFFVLCVAVYFGRVYLVPLLVAAAMMVRCGYGSARLGNQAIYQKYIGTMLVIQGKVKEDPSRSSKSGTSLQIHDVVISGERLPGTVLLSVRKAGEAKRGDIVTVNTVLEGGFGSFPATARAETVASIVRPVPGDIGRVVRDWFADAVRAVIPEPQASLGIGFLTGQKSALPEDLSDALKVAGLTHIVVASGYNLTILVRMARKLFIRFSKYLSAVSSGVMITVFMAITGLSPSMTRAGLVSGLSLVSWYYGHRFHPFVLLPFAAAITVAIQPSYVWGDLGWQLSFSAFAGVMLVAPLIQRYFFGETEPGLLRQILGETLAAHAVTVPLIALSFGTVSHVAIIANMLVVPLVPLAMLLTFLCGVGALLHVPFLWLLGTPTTWLLGYMTNVATFVSELDWAQSEVTTIGLVWLGYTAALVVACIWMWRATKYDFRAADPLM